VTIVNKNISFQVNLVDAYETSKMCMLKFETLPGTDVISYLAEKSTYSEQVSIRLNSNFTFNRMKKIIFNNIHISYLMDGRSVEVLFLLRITFLKCLVSKKH
jgi:hypothetical protein